MTNKLKHSEHAHAMKVILKPIIYHIIINADQNIIMSIKYPITFFMAISF